MRSPGSVLIRGSASRKAGSASRDPLVSYYAALLIGRADTDIDSARAAFQRATNLYPHAQSPRLGLSEIEMRSGNVQAAARELETMWTGDMPGSRSDDPWSSYSTAAGRAGVSRLDAINTAFPPLRRQP